MNYDSILPPGIHQHVGFFSPPQCLHHKEGVSKHRTKRATPKSASKCFILEGGTWWSSWKEHVFRVAPIDFFPVFLCIRELDKVIMWYCMVRWRQPCCLLPFANQTCPAFSSKKSQKTCLTMFDRGFFQRLWIEPLFYSQLSRLILAILPVAMFLVSSWWQGVFVSLFAGQYFRNLAVWARFVWCCHWDQAVFEWRAKETDLAA